MMGWEAEMADNGSCPMTSNANWRQSMQPCKSGGVANSDGSPVFATNGKSAAER